MAEGIMAEPAPAAIQDDGAGGVEVRVEGQDTQPWYVEQLSPEYHTDPNITKYTSLDDFAKGHINQAKLMGARQGVEFPGEEAGAEDWQAFWRKVPGYPETPSGYTVAPPVVPEGSPYTISEAEYTNFLGEMHQAGASPQHVNAFVRWFEKNEADRWSEAQTEAAEMIDRGENAILQKWGARAEYNVRVAEEALLREFGALDFLDQLITKEGSEAPKFLRNSPEFIQMAYEWAVAKGHDKYVAGGPGGPASKEAAMQQMSDARTAFRNGTMSQEGLNELQEKLAPILWADEPDIVAGRTLTAMDMADQ